MALSEHGYYLRMAALEATLSPDPSTQNGSLLLRYNPHRDVADQYIMGHNRPTVPCDLKVVDRSYKIQVIEHAERVPIFKAAKCGMPTEMATLYCLWYACADCARAIVESGIIKVVGSQTMHDATPNRWKDQVNAGLNILRGYADIILCNDKLNVDLTFNGNKITV